MKKMIRFSWMAAAGAVALLASCTKEKSAPDPVLQSFGFYAADNAGKLAADYAGTVSGTSVTVALPPTADKTTLAARFTANDGNVVKVGSVVQVSGVTVNDFSSPVTYVVTDSDNKKSASYTVSISLGPDPAPALTAFAFEVEQNGALLSKTAEGTFKDRDISVGLPQMADVSALIATFATPEGNKVTVDGVEQVSGVTVNDFTNPVDYIVTNSDGSVNAMFSVTVNRVKGEWTFLTTYDALPVYSGPVMKVSPKDQAPYLAFKEREVTSAPSETANKLSVVKFDGTAWAQVGAAGFATPNGSELDLDFDDAGVPYVAFQNDENDPKCASVMKFDGSWSYVGSQATDKELISNKVHFAPLSSDNIIVAQTNNARTGTFARNVMVMISWNGSEWTPSENAALSASLLTYDNRMCKVGKTAYLVSINRGKVEDVNYGNNVLKYQDGAWTALRTNFLQEGATQTSIACLGIAAQEDGTVYILTADDAVSTKSYQIRIEKYAPASGTWSTVGGAPIDYVIESHNYAHIAIAPDGTPFVAYQNYATKSIEVVYLDGDTKQWTAPVSLAAGQVGGELGIAFDASGTGYVGCIDSENHYQVYKFE